jgi:hypothetical protein
MENYKNKYDPLSANTLFHFTNNAENLQLILSEGFKPHYCLEDFSSFESLATTGGELALPMVSFCDIPLATVRRHVDTYGRFGIGLSKRWGKKLGISPVLYLFPEATVGKSLDYILDLVFEQAVQNDDRSLKRIGSLTMSQAKAYEGRLWRGGKYTEERIRFYDEKEWRYVPDVVKVGLPNALWKKDFLQDSIRDEANSKLAEHFRLIFKASDVKYIIVNKESEVLITVKHLKWMTNKFSEDQIELLMTKIVSVDQILDDF